MKTLLEGTYIPLILLLSPLYTSLLLPSELLNAPGCIAAVGDGGVPVIRAGARRLLTVYVPRVISILRFVLFLAVW